MTKTESRSPDDFIVPLRMNGLSGRMLRLPAPLRKKREILFIYGHHSTIERWWNLALVLNRYGAVTMPDLPGFGGMQSFYTIGKTPDIDTMADYLAAFVKLRYARKHVTIVGMSYGFAVVTRMLQRSPYLSKRVELLLSFGGFSHTDDFKVGSRNRLLARAASYVMSSRLASLVFRLSLRQPIIHAGYKFTRNAKYSHLHTSEQRQAMIKAECNLWHANDARTHFYTIHDMLMLDNCKKYIVLPVWHVAIKNDQYFDANLVEQHMRVIFADYHQVTASMKVHAPTIMADAEMAASLIPPKIRQLLR